MTRIEFKGATIRLSDSFCLEALDWRISPSDVWAVVGPNGSGKSALMAGLAGEGKLIGGVISGLPERISLVSLEAQAELIERERERDDSDLTDIIYEGTPVREMIDEVGPDSDLLAELIDRFGFESMMDRGFRKLSTGETRKLLLIRALSSRPELLLLDEPFEGLDSRTIPLVHECLSKLAGRIPVVCVFNRARDIPDYVTHILFLDEGRIRRIVDRNDRGSEDILQQLLNLRRPDVMIPPPEPGSRPPLPDPDAPLAILRKAAIHYGEKTVFENLDWKIETGQHWQLTGPNGSGKTCLLNLITGDHPQCYNNDIQVFGYQRGSGESIWDIKQHIGYVSTALQWEYRVSISAVNVIISGFHDSIGVYQRTTDAQQQIAREWLALLGLEANQPFNQLSYGDQRLLLIARAMVKHPRLLILDEPCLGLDDLNRELVLALVEKICEGAETTVIYVNHHAEDRIRGIDHFLTL